MCKGINRGKNANRCYLDRTHARRCSADQDNLVSVLGRRDFAADHVKERVHRDGRLFADRLIKVWAHQRTFIGKNL